VASAPAALELLDLSNNKIATVDALRPLSSLSSLAALDLGGCPVAASGEGEAAYRAAVFALLPQLTWLDKRNREGAEGCVALRKNVCTCILGFGVLLLTSGVFVCVVARRSEDDDDDDEEDEDEESEDEVRPSRAALRTSCKCTHTHACDVSQRCYLHAHAAPAAAQRAARHAAGAHRRSCAMHAGARRARARYAVPRCARTCAGEQKSSSACIHFARCLLISMHRTMLRRAGRGGG
jgi:hypothetical protein